MREGGLSERQLIFPLMAYCYFPGDSAQECTFYALTKERRTHASSTLVYLVVYISTQKDDHFIFFFATLESLEPAESSNKVRQQY